MSDMLEAVEKKFDPQEYFDYIKSKKKECTDTFLTRFYDVVENQLKKAVVLGQKSIIRKLAFVLKTTEKEYVLKDYGIDTFVLREDIEEFITKVENKVVKIIDLEFYPRTIPDEIAALVIKLKEDNIFDNYYIVFTDYTDEAGKTVANERKRRDPIIFGTFEKKIDGVWNIHDRFYYIGDWEDEYCDLTLSKMVDVMSSNAKAIAHSTLDLPTDEEIRAVVHSLEENDKDPSRMILKPQKEAKEKAVNPVKGGFMGWLKDKLGISKDE